MEDVTARNTSVVACAEATLYTTQAQTVADGPLRMTTTASPAPPTEACFRIPSEIWDIIIDFHHDDHQTLASCSLVCRAWCPTARMHRFHEIKIKPLPGGPPLAASLLCDPTSTVLSYVRRLDLLEGSPASREGGEDHNEKPLASGESITTFWLDNILPVMRIHELTALESVSLGRLRWDILSHPSRCGIMELCRRIRSLKLSCWVLGDTPCSAVLQMLSAATTLQRFELLNHWIHPALLREDELPIPPVPGPALVLHSLCISDVANLYLPALQRYFMTIRVSEVVLSSVVTVDMEVVASFLSSCATSLERVTLRIALPSLRRGRVKVSKAWATQLGCSLSCATLLKSLAVNVSVQHLSCLLQQVASSQFVDLSVKTSLKDLLDEPALQDHGKWMGELERTLTTGPLGAARPHVSFLLLFTTCRPFPRDMSRYYEARNRLLEGFTRLHDEGRLSIMLCTLDLMTREESIESF